MKPTGQCLSLVQCQWHAFGQPGAQVVKHIEHLFNCLSLVGYEPQLSQHHQQWNKAVPHGSPRRGMVLESENGNSLLLRQSFERSSGGNGKSLAVEARRLGKAIQRLFGHAGVARSNQQSPVIDEAWYAVVTMRPEHSPGLLTKQCAQ